MSFMDIYIYNKAPTYAADCGKCGASIYAHPDTGCTEQELRDGTAECGQCTGHADPVTVSYCGKLYAGRYSANGYMDCTDWSYDANLRNLKRELRAMYGD